MCVCVERACGARMPQAGATRVSRGRNPRLGELAVCAISTRYACTNWVVHAGGTVWDRVARASLCLSCACFARVPADGLACTLTHFRGP